MMRERITVNTMPTMMMPMNASAIFSSRSTFFCGTATSMTVWVIFGTARLVTDAKAERNSASSIFHLCLPM